MTETRTVKTSEIRVGDIVRNYGMRIRIDSITEYQPSELDRRQGSVKPYWACLGTVINLDEVREAGVVPMSWLTTQKWVDGAGWTIDRRDYWNVQGNDLASWQVEQPEPQAEVGPNGNRVQVNTRALALQMAEVHLRADSTKARELLATAEAEGRAESGYGYVTFDAEAQFAFEIYASEPVTA